jgi:hypothetical protein
MCTGVGEAVSEGEDLGVEDGVAGDVVRRVGRADVRTGPTPTALSWPQDAANRPAARIAGITLWREVLMTVPPFPWASY